jgi:hypothetical protein
MTFMITKSTVEDFDTWKALFDTDPPKARTEATGYRVYRGAEDPNQVVVQVEFATPEKAKAARDRLVASRVLDRLSDVSGPTIVEEAEAITL